jgi:hypothetical protein
MTSTIKISVNGDASPNISMPISAFMGEGYQGCAGSYVIFANEFFGSSAACNIQNTYFCAGSGTNGAGAWSKMPIPFSNGITITLTMSTATPGSGTLWSNIQGDTATDNFPYTEKLWASYILPSTSGGGAGSGLGVATGASTASYAQEKIVDYAGSNPGRYIGTYFLDDDTPGSLSPKYATLEGNYRIYTDASNAVWTASATLSTTTKIMDSNGNLQTASSGTTGGSIPSSWGCYTGATTTDNTVTWTATVGEPWTVWRASKAYSLACMSVLDTNGNIETITTTGTSGSSAPAWPSTGSCTGTTTTDNTAHWRCSLGSTMIKAAMRSTGTEDYFLSSNYFQNYTAPFAFGTGGLDSGIGFPYNTSGNGTVSAYRFYKYEPIRFNHSVTVYRENGDSSQVPISSGTSTALETGWWYTQDTN